MVDKVAGDGQPGVAITDHGVLFGLVDFHNTARKAGVNPILGSELYQAHGSRRDQQRTPSGDRYYHLTALAMNDVGYRNLMAISTAAYLEGQWYKPRIDKEILEKHSEGIICLSGCVSSEFSRAILKGIATE
jgi:DNA polymerase-3 subunit alpha